MLFHQEQFRQRLAGRENFGVELCELLLSVSQPAAHVGQCGVAFLLVAVGLLELGPQHVDALFAFGGGESASRWWRPVER